MKILAIDPGNERSAWVIYEPAKQVIYTHEIYENGELLSQIAGGNGWGDSPSHCAIEMIASYGMAVGREVFETCVWIGRFYDAWQQAFDCEPTLIYRRDVKMELCGNNTAKDSNIRQALIDRFGPGKDRAIGKKATPGPLFGIAKDEWSALAVGVTFAARLNTTIKAAG